MRVHVFSIAFSVLAVFTTAVAPAGTQDMEERRVSVAGQERTLYLYVPPSWSQRPDRPLVIALHGGGTNGKSMARFSALNEKARQAGFMVAYPNGIGRAAKVLTWNSGKCCGYASSQRIDDVQFISRLIDDLVTRNGVDRTRVYATGISNGAMMAYRIAAELSDRIAAVAPVAGTLDIDPSAIHGSVPVIHFHGTDDQYVPFGGGHGPRSALKDVHRSVDETIQAWVKANNASSRPLVTNMPDVAKDGTTVTRYVYASPNDPQAVVLYKIFGGGHTWPGQPSHERVLGRTTLDISANDLMWDFFKSHRKARP